MGNEGDVIDEETRSEIEVHSELTIRIARARRRRVGKAPQIPTPCTRVGQRDPPYRARRITSRG